MKKVETRNENFFAEI